MCLTVDHEATERLREQMLADGGMMEFPKVVVSVGDGEPWQPRYFRDHPPDGYRKGAIAIAAGEGIHVAVDEAAALEWRRRHCREVVMRMGGKIPMPSLLIRVQCHVDDLIHAGDAGGMPGAAFRKVFVVGMWEDSK